MPTPEQREVIESDESFLVVGGPGRGKTATAIASANAWLARHPDSHVVFTSFSNAAVRRIGEAAKLGGASSRQLRLRTFHALAMDLLRSYGRFVAIRGKVRVLDKAEERYEFARRGWLDLREEERRDVLLQLAREEGLVGFDVMLPLAAALLQASPTLRRAVSLANPFFIVDEFQDTSSEQWSFVKLAGESSRVIALGDPNQMIYAAQYDAAIQRFVAFEQWKGAKRITLTGRSFRCDADCILSFADALLSGSRFEGGGDELAFAAAYPNQFRSKLAAIAATIRRQVGRESSIGFLVPSRKLAQDTAGALRNPPATSRVKIKLRTRVESQEADLDSFLLAACAAVDYVKAPSDVSRTMLARMLTVFITNWSRKVVSSKSLEQIEKRLRPKSRAKSSLRDLLALELPETFSDFLMSFGAALSEDTFFASSGSAIAAVGLPQCKGVTLQDESLVAAFMEQRKGRLLDGPRFRQGDTSILSMHRAKGREFDFVVMVIEPRAHSTNTTLDELRRLYYVAATRAKEWLGVVYVPNRPGPVLGPVLGLAEGE